MAETPNFQAGDYGFLLGFELQDESGEPPPVELSDVTEAQVTFWRIDDNSSAFVRDVEVPGGIDEEGGRVLYRVAAGDLTIPGEYQAQVILTGVDFVRRSAPSSFHVAGNVPEVVGS